ncbi:MAG: PD-(D/E)XK nuclease family protein [Firmicutes bacterium]|nr:PD-(D/E)XK nuclease family protein [Bacillota bacterium]
MPLNDVKEMYFSQNSINTYDNCYLKFRRRYIDGLYWPGSWVTDKDKRENIERGKLFHLLAERYYSGIPTGDLQHSMDGEVVRWFANLKKFRPLTDEADFFPEQEIRFCQDGMKIMAKYDLLMAHPDGRAVIFDWKTNANKPKSQYYQRHMQTIVYRYLLAKAGEDFSPQNKLLPSDISMVYWNPRYPSMVEPISYTQERLANDEKLMKDKIREITGRSYEDFYATSDEKKCRYCEYSPICHGKPMLEDPLDEIDEELDLDWNDIDESLFE